MPRFKPRFELKTPSLFDSLEMTDFVPQKNTELKFISFGSGSSGNCAYLGTDTEGFLIDAGVQPDVVKSELHRRGISMGRVKGILLTHDHKDHIRYTYKILRKNPHMALFATPKALSGIFLRHSLTSRLKDYHRPIFIETPFRLGQFTITAFNAPHDSSDNVGYLIDTGSCKFAVATDLGAITDRVDFYLRQANYIMIESNYDAEMLRNGPYPVYLKARIESRTGHLDNRETASFLADIYTPQLTHIFLCHLSDHNNTPEIALEQTRNALMEKGITVGDASGKFDQVSAQVQLTALPRYTPSAMFILR